MSYNTKQKNLILKIIKTKKSAFTVKDIYNEVKDNTGLTTIYRLIDKLVSDGVLVKNISSDNITYYQYFEKCEHENHFYLKCDNCGNVIHIDCDCIKGLIDHIYNKHKFRPNRDHIIINGICQNCAVKGDR